MTCQVYKALDCEHDPEQLRMQSATVANLGEKYTQGEALGAVPRIYRGCVCWKGLGFCQVEGL